jgi:15-cis-phytoene synthase
VSISAASPTPEEVTRKAKSNLALALACLPLERREDMVRFYAFCRVADDIADEPGLASAVREARLAEWRACVLEKRLSGDLVLDAVLGLPEKYDFPRAWLAEILDGVASDIQPVRYETYAHLQTYCYPVACVVGLVSIHVFGCQHPQSREYAVELGYALQLTNILRDVGEDAREYGRIYLPADDLKRFGVAEADLLAGRVEGAGFRQLMEFQYQRARQHYQRAVELLPVEDAGALLASEMMRQVYSEILEKLRRTGYPVFAGRCRLSKVRKLMILLRYWWRMRRVQSGAMVKAQA